ncbi:MotA/TolQ/ExbB proton channel family protein [Candidatus Rariloculus sp.]|uniref:MotA/TolQ/ExbB proton channel family protein n=1 Tax=Candidatus Rariloculus sp. TaxID=3101265 RepID=UPI003D0CF38C
MKTYQFISAVVLGSCLAAGPAFAQEAADLNELLEAVREGGGRDAGQHQQRLDEFQQRQADQTRLLQEAQTQLANEQARSVQLDAQFDENEILIENVQAQLDERLGSLRELFGVLQQVSGDARSQFENSLTNVEFPDRAAFLTEFATKAGSGTRLPSIEEIEQLWFELQREATEQGKVKRLSDFGFVTAGGQQVSDDVVRVGTFNLVADGRYLAHNPETNSVSELQRQPSQARFINSTADLVGAQPGGDLVRFGVDITSGQLLSLLIETPNIRERIEQGAEVGYVIIALGIFGVLLALERLLTLSIVGNNVRAQLKRETPSEKNPLGRVLKVYEENKAVDTETLELKLGEAILKETPSLQRGILFIKVISVVAPLLGLLGTVVGMINTFQAITLFGTGDPTIMAGGISQALMTTVLGLCVAIPTVLLHTLVSGRSRRIVQILQEQSAGIVANQAEKAQ